MAWCVAACTLAAPACSLLDLGDLTAGRTPEGGSTGTGTSGGMGGVGGTAASGSGGGPFDDGGLGGTGGEPAGGSGGNSQGGGGAAGRGGTSGNGGTTSGSGGGGAAGEGGGAGDGGTAGQGGQGGTGGQGADGGGGGTGGEAVLTLVSTSPANDDTNVAVDTDVSFTFDSDVEAGAGNVTLRLLSSDALVEEVDVTTAAVTTSGVTLTVDLSADLAVGTSYYVELDSGAAESADGVAFDGFSGAGTLTFHTVPPPGPETVSDLLAWFDADDASSLTVSSGDVSGWDDLSGNDYHLAQPTGSLQPTRQTSVIAGRPIVRFAGAEVLEGPDLPEGTEVEVFVVWQSPVAAPTTLSQIVGAGGGFEINHGHPFAEATHGVSVRFGTENGDWLSVNFAVPTTNTPILWDARYDDAAKQLRSVTNGAATESVATTNPIADHAFDLAVGAWVDTDTTVSRYFNGDVAEIMIYSRALSAAERDRIEAYVEYKWGIDTSP